MLVTVGLTSPDENRSPVPPPVRELVWAEPVPGGQGSGVAPLGERLIDAGARLLAFTGSEGVLVVSRVHGVQGQDDALHCGEDPCLVPLGERGRLGLERVQDGIGLQQELFGEQFDHARAVRSWSGPCSATPTA